MYPAFVHEVVGYCYLWVINFQFKFNYIFISISNLYLKEAEDLISIFIYFKLREPSFRNRPPRCAAGCGLKLVNPDQPLQSDWLMTLQLNVHGFRFCQNGRWISSADMFHLQVCFMFFVLCVVCLQFDVDMCVVVGEGSMLIGKGSDRVCMCVILQVQG